MSEETLATMDCTEIINPDPIIHLTENGVEGFEVLCRLCANRSDHLIPIYSEEGVSNDLADKMNMYLPIKVAKTDLLPLQCCFQCATTVLTWHELVVATLEADRRLRDVQIEVEKQLLPEENVTIASEPAPGTSQEEIGLKNEELILPHEGDEDDDDGYHEVTVLYVEDNGEENYGSISSYGQLDDHEEVKNNSEEEEEEEEVKNNSEEEEEEVDGSNVSLSDQQEVNDNSEDEETIIKSGSKKEEKNAKTENANNLIDEEERFLNDCEYVDNEVMESGYLHLSDSSNNDTEGLIDFEEKIKNTVVAVRHLPKKMHECEICSKKFRRQSNLNSHITTHVADFFCHVCCKSFNTKFKLDCHLPEHPRDKITLRKKDPAFMICKEGCLGKFYSKLQLYEHKETHLDHMKNHICGLCHKRFNTFNKLNTHQKSHQPVECDLCHKTYASHNTFRMHSQRCHQKKIDPVTCKTCGASFRHQGLLTNHETIHSDVKKYECAYCHKTFGRSNYLKDHLKTHFIDKPFKCEQCDSAYTQKNILVTHVKMKHRVCGMCDQTVGDALQLRVHLWKYHGREDPEFEIVEIEEENDTTM